MHVCRYVTLQRRVYVAAVCLCTMVHASCWAVPLRVVSVSSLHVCVRLFFRAFVPFPFVCDGTCTCEPTRPRCNRRRKGKQDESTQMCVAMPKPKERRQAKRERERKEIQRREERSNTPSRTYASTSPCRKPHTL